ncbi:hypothetical protein DL767_009753 [Monosporascus sp. MG133]|nr:hypothetical protein DL767_009753 [Monosporascus sp. MG133]
MKAKKAIRPDLKYTKKLGLNWSPEERDGYISNIKVGRRRAIINLDKSRLRYVIKQDESVMFRDADTKELVLVVLRNFIPDDNIRETMIEICREILKYRRDDRREDPGMPVHFGYTCGSRHEPRIQMAAPNIRLDTHEKQEREGLLNVKAQGMTGLLWNLMRSRLPPEIIAEYNDLIEKYDLPSMDMMREDDTFSFKIDGKEVTFRDLELPAPSGLSAINYARYRHKEINGNNWIVACTCKAPRSPDKGGNFYLASYGIMMEPASNTVSAWRPTDYHGTTLYEMMEGPEKRAGYEVRPHGEINTGMVFEVSKAIKNARYNSDWLNERARSKPSKPLGQAAAGINKQTSPSLADIPIAISSYGERLLKPTSESVDANAYTTPFMLTQSMRRDVYPVVDPPTNPELETSSEVALAKSWSVAKAQGTVLVGRKLESLHSTAVELETSFKVVSIAADVTSQTDVDAVCKKAVDEFGRVDILVNAHRGMNVGSIGAIDLSKWWMNFEVNTRDVYDMCRGFVSPKDGSGTIIDEMSLAACFVAAGMSSYSASKLAVIKFDETLTVEQPALQVFSIHPGMVEAENGRGMVVEAFLPFSKDKAALAGSLTVYLATPRADFLKGEYIHVNWDVVELEKHEVEIIEK